jgi:hypothetical protein
LAVWFFFTGFGFASSSTHALPNDTKVKVNLQLEVDGDIPSCEKVVVGNQYRNIDCHDAFFNDGPFIDTHTIDFTVPKNTSTDTQKYDVCLTGSHREEILSCHTIENGDNPNQTTEVTFRFTANGIDVDNSTSIARDQNGSSFIMNAIFINEKGRPCPDVVLYVNHPKLSNDKTHVDCEKMFYGFAPFKQTHTVEKTIPAGTIKEEEVFEICVEYEKGRTCKLVKNEMEDNSEFAVFDLTKIIS